MKPITFRTMRASALALALGSSAVAQSSPGQNVGIASVPNLRDVGGYTTRHRATVRTKLVYRSDQLNPISVDDLKTLAGLGLKSDFDLRTAEERNARPDVLPPGVNNIWLNVLADADQSGPAQLEKLMHNPKEANVQLGSGKVEAKFLQAYRDFVSLPSAKAAYRRLFVALADRNSLPALFHCTTGKDRTGWAAAALLSLLGVSKDAIMRDFLRSNDYILPAYRKTIDAFVAAGGEPGIPAAILGVKAEYLEAAFAEMENKYGTTEDYFTKGLGIDFNGQQALRDLLLARN
jgi:protein-tyrosine phosphatase